MKIYDIKNGYDKNLVKDIASLLQEGEILVLPTDTVYGIVCDVLNENAVKNIYEIKKRKTSNPCSILTSDINMIKKYTKNISKLEEEIIKKILPGALTIVLEKNDKISNTVTANLETVGVRIPDNAFLLDVIKEFGRPIVATSCNMAKENAIYKLEDISNNIKDNISYAVDMGETKEKIASTVIRVQNNEIKILREGSISKESFFRISIG